MRTGSARRDAGALELGWLTKLLVFLAVAGVFGYDGVSVMSTKIKGEDDAQDAANAASEAFHHTHNIDAAYQAAVAAVNPDQDTVLTQDFTIDADGTAHLLVRRHATTLVLSRFHATRKWTVQTLHGDANDTN